MIFVISVPEWLIITSGTTIMGQFWNFFTLCSYKQQISPHVVGNMIFVVSVPDWPIITIGTTILGQFWNLFTSFSYIQQIFITCCWQYDICNQHTRLTNNNYWNHDFGTILKFVYYIFIYTTNIYHMLLGIWYL